METPMTHLIAPHGGSLKDLMLAGTERESSIARARALPSLDLSPRQLCDLELLMSGAFSPLDGFMLPADHERVCNEMRLASGLLWPIPVTLDVQPDLAER